MTVVMLCVVVCIDMGIRVVCYNISGLQAVTSRWAGLTPSVEYKSSSLTADH